MDKPVSPKLPNIAPTKFFREVVNELSKVTWPTKKEATRLTAAVIMISLGVGVFIGGLDIVFLKSTSTVFK